MPLVLSSALEGQYQEGVEALREVRDNDNDPSQREQSLHVTLCTTQRCVSTDHVALYHVASNPVGCFSFEVHRTCTHAFRSCTVLQKMTQ